MTNKPIKTKSKTKLNWKKIFTSLGIVMIVLCLAGGSFFAWTIYKETEDFSAKKLLSEEPSKIYDDKGELNMEVMLMVNVKTSLMKIYHKY